MVGSQRDKGVNEERREKNKNRQRNKVCPYDYSIWAVHHAVSRKNRIAKIYQFLLFLKINQTKDKRNKLTRLAGIVIKLKNKEFIVSSNRNVNMDGIIN